MCLDLFKCYIISKFIKHNWEMKGYLMIMTNVLDNVHCLGVFKQNVLKQTQFLKCV
jgi:hypothetical protein